MFLLLNKDFQFDLVVQTSVFCVGLFVVCMVCHGELVLAKPAPQHLTRFYLLVSIGGALGALVVSVLAPLLFATYVETAAALLVAALLFVPIAQAGYIRFCNGWLALAIGVVGTAGWYVRGGTQERRRSDAQLYGVLKVKSYDEPGSDGYLVRLVHGAILHGEQYPHEKWRREPTTYYANLRLRPCRQPAAGERTADPQHAAHWHDRTRRRHSRRLVPRWRRLPHLRNQR